MSFQHCRISIVDKSFEYSRSLESLYMGVKSMHSSFGYTVETRITKEGKKRKKKGNKKNIVAQSWREAEYSVRISRVGGQGRYLQFRGSIHKQVGDTNLSVRVTFSTSPFPPALPSPHPPTLILHEKARGKANDPAWLSRAKARRRLSFRDNADCGWIKRTWL